MIHRHSRIIGPWPSAAEASLYPGEDASDCSIAEPPEPYRPRHPERTGFYQLFETHFDSYVRAYEDRFEHRSGRLRPVVVRSMENFPGCGRLQGGFARIRCPKCRAEHLLAFSCRTRQARDINKRYRFSAFNPGLPDFAYPRPISCQRSASILSIARASRSE